MVQNESSAQVAPFLAPHAEETILEIGAAPGGKTTHIAAIMQNRGHIVAVDNSSKRLKKLSENCARLGVTIVEPMVADAETLNKATDQNRFDKVLIDAPCSGTGTLSKNPEILLVLKESDFARYAQTQQKLLESGFAALKPKGALVYSTCSMDAAENRDVIQKFVENHSTTANLLEERVILPEPYRDGFYIVKIQKH